MSDTDRKPASTPEGPREFWVWNTRRDARSTVWYAKPWFEIKIVPPSKINQNWEPVHVIEKSAYDALAAENKALKLDAYDHGMKLLEDKNAELLQWCERLAGVINISLHENPNVVEYYEQRREIVAEFEAWRKEKGL